MLDCMFTSSANKILCTKFGRGYHEVMKAKPTNSTPSPFTCAVEVSVCLNSPHIHTHTYTHTRNLSSLLQLAAKLSELTSSHLGGGEEDGVLFDDVSEDDDDPMD